MKSKSHAKRAMMAILFAATTLCCTSIASAAPRQTLSFRQNRLEKCDYFLVTESSVSAINTRSQDPVNALILTNAFGVMRNIDHSRAVGVSIDVHVASGARWAPTARFKQWLSRRSSVDVTLGYALTPLDESGLTGWIGDVRYSPAPWFHVRSGVCRIRTVSSITYFPELHVEESTRTRFHAGIGVGEVPGVVSWGVQAIVFASLVALLSGMS